MYQGILLIFSIGVIGLVYSADTCRKVNENKILCLEEEQTELNLECPKGHNIVTRYAYYKYYPGEECPSDEDISRACDLSSFYENIREECNVKTQCSLTVPKVSKSCGNFANGRHLLHLSYKCEPVFRFHSNARAIDMCYKESFTGTLSFVNTHPLGLLGNYIYDTPCVVVFDVPKNTQLEIRVPYFQTSQPVEECDIHMEVWNKYQKYQLCTSPAGPFRFPCSEEDLAYGLRFVTRTPQIGAIQVVSIAVGHKESFTIRGNQTDIPPFPEELVTTTPPTAAASSDQGWFMANSKYIIGGCMGAAVLIIVITVLVVVFKYRKDGHSELQESETSSTSTETPSRGYNFVAEIYVDGENKSKLMNGSLGKHSKLTGKDSYGYSFAKSDKI